VKVPSPLPYGVNYSALCRPGLLTKDTAHYAAEHERIFGPPKAKPGHYSYRYVGGKRIEIPNPSTCPPILNEIGIKAQKIDVTFIKTGLKVGETMKGPCGSTIGRFQ
jgi:hypothetical protein